jgi:Zn-dependent protease
MPARLGACPACGRLVHAERLKRLASDAQAAEARGELRPALELWQEALGLLPPASTQHRTIAATVERLTAVAPPPADSPLGPPSPRAPGRARWLAGAGGVAAVVAKFKWLLLVLATKGKLLLVGLTQAKTFLSMAVALGVYSMAFGWKFAAGLIASIYVHEMGHVAWLRHYGIPATAPMFIPGFGAFVRLKRNPATPAQDARVGLAGPVWGTAAALAFLLAGVGTGWPMLLAIGRVGAWINLFNLIPVWQLDGSRAFAALSRRQRAWTAAALWPAALVSHDGMTFLLAIAATARALGKKAPAQGDRPVLALYLGLAIGLTALIAVSGGPLKP